MGYQTLAGLLLHNARTCARHPAVSEGKEILSHEEYAARGWSLAHGMIKRGMKKGDRFAVLSQNSLRYMELYAAADSSGLVLTTLNWRLALPELVKIVQNAEPVILFFESRFAEAAFAIAKAQAAPPLLACTDAELAGASIFEDFVSSECNPPHPPSSPDPAYLIYTSGTTGQPKGVMLSHGGMASAAQNYALEMAVHARESIVLPMPLFHIGARIEGLIMQYMGGAQFLMSQFEPELVLDWIERFRATRVHMAPVMIKRVVEHPSLGTYDLSSLRRICYGSAPMAVTDLEKAHRVFGRILNQGYGMTEQLCCSMMPPEMHILEGTAVESQRLSSAGQPLRGTEIKIVDPDGHSLPIGAIGEIAVRASSLMLGYWRQPELTAEVVKDGWMHTGDVGYLDEDAFLFIVDRKKDMIISGGENIYSREVEEALLTHESVSAVAVIGVPDVRWGESVHAVVVPRPGAVTTADELIEHVRSRVASFKKPRSIAFADELPRLATGKVDKKALRAPFWSGQTRQIA